jgi:hypothetical protein
MNYTTITINDTKLGLKFGMASFRYLQTKFIDGIAFENNELNEIGVAHIIYSGYYNNCIVKDIELGLSFEYFVDWVESNLKNEDSLNQIKNIINVWAESDFIKQTQQDDKSKKKTSRLKK